MVGEMEIVFLSFLSNLCHNVGLDLYSAVDLTKFQLENDNFH